MGATRLHKIPLRFNPATSRYIYKSRKQVKQANYKSDATCMWLISSHTSLNSTKPLESKAAPDNNVEDHAVSWHLQPTS